MSKRKAIRDGYHQVQAEAEEIVRRYNESLHVAARETRMDYRGVRTASGATDYSLHVPNALGRQISSIQPFETQTRANGRPL